MRKSLTPHDDMILRSQYELYMAVHQNIYIYQCLYFAESLPKSLYMHYIYRYRYIYIFVYLPVGVLINLHSPSLIFPRENKYQLSDLKYLSKYTFIWILFACNIDAIPVLLCSRLDFGKNLKIKKTMKKNFGNILNVHN